MKASSTLVVSLLGTALSFCGIKAFGATLTPGLDNATGRRVYTDLWGPVDVREMDKEFQVSLLGSTLALGVAGTNVDVKLMVAIISYGTNDYPRGSSGGISAQVRSSTNEANLKNLLGQLDSSVVLHPGATNGPIKATRRGREPLENQRTLFLYELDFSIPLKKKLSEIPEFISILSGMCGGLSFWRYTRMTVERPATPPEARAPVSQRKVPAAPVNVDPKGERILEADIEPRPAAKALPEIRLSVTRENDYLLITCSPAAEGGELEEADSRASPLSWRPLRNGTNQGSRWYVPPSDGARMFRIRIGK